jgi:hypothetical protein
MQRKMRMHLSPRWLAQTRARSPCQSPAMANGRCRMHWGKSPGASTGNTNALKHGKYSAQSKEIARMVAALRANLKG